MKNENSLITITKEIIEQFQLVSHYSEELLLLYIEEHCYYFFKLTDLDIGILIYKNNKGNM